MDFFVQWVCYLLAFLVGSVMAWLLPVVTVERTSEDDAFADLPSSREIGDR